MLRISKLTDYGVVLATHMAQAESAEPRTVRELAAETHIPQPTVGKVLKLLARGGVVESQRGARGGYRLARAPASTTIAEVIEALEGPIAVTECTSDDGTESCAHEGVCEVQGNWQRINDAVHTALSAITLAAMGTPGAALVPLALSAGEARRHRRAQPAPGARPASSDDAAEAAAEQPSH
jgi:FeS assembly SUF system regulator